MQSQPTIISRKETAFSTGIVDSLKVLKTYGLTPSPRSAHEDIPGDGDATNGEHGRVTGSLTSTGSISNALGGVSCFIVIFTLDWD